MAASHSDTAPAPPILSAAEAPLARVSCASTRSAPATNALAVSHNTARLGNLSVNSDRGSTAPSSRPGSLALPSSRCGSVAAASAPKPDFDDLAKNVLGAMRGLRVPAKILAKGAGRAARDKAIEWAERSLGSGLDKVSVSVKTSIEADPEPPAFVRGFFVNVWETLWGQLRDPLAAYLLLEFGKLAGEFAEPPPQPAKRHAWYDLRARWRRTICPHDAPVWRNMRNWEWWCHLALSMCPYYGVAPLYYITWFCLLERRDEYQLCLFILGFKALSSITGGVFLFVSGAMRAAVTEDLILRCVATHGYDDARECAEATMPFPGNRDAYVWEMACFCAQVVAVWCAFLLLPFSNDDAVRPVETHTPKSARKSRRFTRLQLPATSRAALLPTVNFKRGGILRQMFAYEVCCVAVCASIVSAYELWYHLDDAGRTADDDAALQLVRLRSALYWVRALYGLLSTPFLIFSLPLYLGLGQFVLTQSACTGYDEAGRCVRALSARESLEKKRKLEEDAADDAQLAAEEAEEAAGVPAADGVVARLRDDAADRVGARPAHVVRLQELYGDAAAMV